MGRCKDGAITNFLAVCSCGSLYGAITNFLAGRSCGSLEGLSYHEFSGSASLWVAVWTELPRILWEGGPMGHCKDEAITNFLAVRSSGVL